jgi:hypothetical protein
MLMPISHIENTHNHFNLGFVIQIDISFNLVTNVNLTSILLPILEMGVEVEL